MSVTWLEAKEYNQYYANPVVRNLIRQVMQEPENDLFAIFDKVLPPEPEREWWVSFKHKFWIFFSSDYRKNYVTSIKKINNTALDTISKLNGNIADLKKFQDLQHDYTRFKAELEQHTQKNNGLLGYFFNVREPNPAEDEIEKIQQQLDNYLDGKQAKPIKLANLHDELEIKKQTIADCVAKIKKFRTFFPDTKLSEAANILNTIELPGSITHQEQALKDIADRIHPEMAEVWKQLFDKYPEGPIKTWSCHPATGDFILSLKQPIKMWVPSSDEQGNEDPRGGIVLMLGDKDLQVKGKLNKDKKEMLFTDAFWARCRYTLAGFTLNISPNVEKLTYESSERVIFSAGIRFKGFRHTKHRPKTIDYLMKNWAENGKVVENPDDVIAQKLGEKV